MGTNGIAGSQTNAVDGNKNTATTFGTTTLKSVMSITLCEPKPFKPGPIVADNGRLDGVVNPNTDTKPANDFNACYPPSSNMDILSMMEYDASAGFNSPYTLKFVPTQAFKAQMKSYIKYVNSVNPAINELNINWKIRIHGTGASPGSGSGIIQNHFTSWHSSLQTPNSVEAYNGQIDFFKLFPFQVDTWYSIETGTYLNDKNTFFPRECGDRRVFFRISQQKSAGGGITFEKVLREGDNKSTYVRVLEMEPKLERKR